MPNHSALSTSGKPCIIPMLGVHSLSQQLLSMD